MLQYSHAEPTGRASTSVDSARAWRSVAPGLSSKSVMGRSPDNWGSPLDLTVFDELHHRQSGEGLGQRANDEGCMWSRLFTAGAGPAKAAQVCDLVVLHNGEGHTRNIQPLHLPFDMS